MIDKHEAIVILFSVRVPLEGHTQYILDECFEMFENVGLVIDIFLIGMN